MSDDTLFRSAATAPEGNDSRDQGSADRLNVLNDKAGVWRCRTIFNCTDACPRGIQVTRAIEQVKRTILYDRA